MNQDEKRSLIEKLLSQTYLADEDATKSLLHEALLRDTREGKLYKYRSVNTNAIDNLEKGTLYCAEPIQFNDPFDCKVGITFKSLYETRYYHEINLLKEIIEKFLLIIKGKMKKEECEENEKRIILKLLDSKPLVRLATESLKRDASLEEEKSIFKNHEQLILEMIKMVLSDETFKDSLGICAEMLPHLYERLTPEGKLVLLDDDMKLEEFAKVNGVSVDTDEIELTVLIITKLFPEYSCEMEKVQDVFNQMEHNIADRLNHLFRVGCLATDYKNRLMWSHYANGHKGFCIEFDFSRKDEKTMACLPFPIIYSSERPLVPWKAAIDNMTDTIAEASSELMLGMLTKDSAWSYENEWRILVPAGLDANIEMPSISAIYLGADMPNDHKSMMIKIAKRKGIQVKQMMVDRGDYILHAKDI